MKRIAWLTLIVAMMLVSTASAAYVAISAPQTVYVGEPLEVTGTTIVGGSPGLRSIQGSARRSSYTFSSQGRAK